MCDGNDRYETHEVLSTQAYNVVAAVVAMAAVVAAMAMAVVCVYLCGVGGRGEGAYGACS